MADELTNEHVAVVDLADELGVRKQTIFKALKRLGVSGTQQRGDARARGQMIAMISAEDAVKVRLALMGSAESDVNESKPQGFGQAPPWRI